MPPRSEFATFEIRGFTLRDGSSWRVESLVHPILEIGGLELRTFGLVLVAAILLAIGIAEIRARRRGFPRGSIARLAAYVLPSAWLGGQIVALAVSVSDGTTREVVDGLFTSSGAWYGSLLGGVAGVFVFCRRARVRPAELLDVIVPGVAAAKIVGPVGCFLAGCDYGRRADGVPWAVRPTGGRAIFHAEEWTWSLAAAIGDPDWGGSLAQAYERAVTLVLRSLLRLGVPAALAARGPRSGGRVATPGTAGEGDTAHARFDAAAADPAGAACFTATARHEIVLAGRKLVGCAQRRGARALLQQGSVLLGAGHERLADYLRVPEAARAVARRALAASATHAGDRLGARPPLVRWADALAAELPGARRFDGPAGAFLLTLSETPSYTAGA